MTFSTSSFAASYPLAVLCAQFVLWWAANNIYAIDAELFFRRFPSRLFCADLTFTQTCIGLCLAAFTTSWRITSPPSAPHPPKAHPLLPRFALLPIAIGALHFGGSLLTNASYSLIGSTSTLMWKLTEPLAAMALKYTILHETTSGTSVLGVLTVLAGVLWFSKGSFALLSFSPIVLANIMFPSRNVALKLDQRSQPDDTPSAQRYAKMLVSAFPLCLLALAVKALLEGVSLDAAPYLIRNALLFNAYQFTSFALLEKLDALTHSLLNTFKRFTGIILSMVVIGSPAHSNHYEGFALTLVGFSMYIGGGNEFSRKLRNKNLVPAIIITFLVACGVASSISDLSAHHAKHRSHSLGLTIDHNTSNSAPSSTERAEAAYAPSNINIAPKGNYLIHLHNPYNYRNLSFDSYEDAANDEYGNVGNMVWQYGAHIALPDFTQVATCVGEVEKCREHPSLKDGAKLLQYFPQANNLNPTALTRFKTSVKAMESGLIDELLAVGLGVQISFDLNSTSDDLEPGKKIMVDPTDYEIPEMTYKYFAALQKRSTPMLVRGDFTRSVTQRAGYTLAYSAGCPSLWINEDVHMGRTLEEKYRQLGSRIGDRSLKVAVNVKMPPRYRQLFTHIMNKYPNSVFYCQGKGDVRYLRMLGLPFERVRLYATVEEWRDSLREMDVSFGARIHGNMIALGAGIPVFVVAPDHRVLELVQRMKIPHASAYDSIFSETDLDIAKLASEYGFDGQEFDRNRCGIAKMYIEVFSQYGFGVRPHVRAVSELC